MQPGEMRRSERHALQFRIVYDDGNTYYVGVVDDISDTGMLLETPEMLPIGAVVRLEPVDPEEDALFELNARVVRHLAPDDLVRRVSADGGHGLVGLGLEFVDLDSEEQAAVHAMIRHLRARRPKSIDPYLGRSVV